MAASVRRTGLRQSMPTGSRGPAVLAMDLMASTAKTALLGMPGCSGCRPDPRSARGRTTTVGRRLRSRRHAVRGVRASAFATLEVGAPFITAPMRAVVLAWAVSCTSKPCAGGSSASRASHASRAKMPPPPQADDACSRRRDLVWAGVSITDRACRARTRPVRAGQRPPWPRRRRVRGQRFGRLLRPQDRLHRHDDGEFLLVMPDIPAVHAPPQAARQRRRAGSPACATAASRSRPTRPCMSQANARTSRLRMPMPREVPRPRSRCERRARCRCTHGLQSHRLRRAAGHWP